MATIFFTSSAIAYLFSGTICYFAFRANLNREGQAASPIAKVQIPLFWPLWIAKELH